MNRIFKISNSFEVPDGTVVSPFLNPKDIFSDLPFDAFNGFSLSAGEIKPQIRSKIHIHPIVTQVTFVYAGCIIVHMKDRATAKPYKIELHKGEAVLTLPGTFFQLENIFQETCHVLYIVSPEYVFLMQDEKVIYDDAIVLDQGWQDLATVTPNALFSLTDYAKSRSSALETIATDKRFKRY